MSVARAVLAVVLCVPAGARASETSSIEIAPGGDAEVVVALENGFVLGETLRLRGGIHADAYLIRLDGLGDPEPVSILRPALAASAQWRPTAWLAMDASIALGRSAPHMMRECAIMMIRSDLSAGLRFRDSVDRIDLAVDRAFGDTTIGFQIENLFDVAPRDVTELKPDPPLQALLTFSRAL